jgi:hypothetical protein
MTMEQKMKLQELKKKYSVLSRINDKIMNSDFAVITEFAAWTVGILITILFGGAAIYGTAGTGTAAANLMESGPIIITSLLPAIAIRGVRGGFKIAERHAYNDYINKYKSNELINIFTRGIDQIVVLSKEKSLNRAELDRMVEKLIQIVKKKEKDISPYQEQQIEDAIMQHVQEITKDLPSDRKRILGEIFRVYSK